MSILDLFKKKKHTKKTDEQKTSEKAQKKSLIEVEVENAPAKNSKKVAKENTAKENTAKENTAKENTAKKETVKEIKEASPKTAAPNKSEGKPTQKANDIHATDSKEPKNAPETTQENTSEEITGRFEINKSKDGKKFFFNLYASNKIGIATSQMYSTAQSALNGIKSVIANADKAPIEDQTLKNHETLPFPKWEIYIDNGGKYRFRLNASNGNCVCHSQGYTTKASCKNGIDSIIRSSKNAEVEKTYLSKGND